MISMIFCCLLDSLNSELSSIIVAFQVSSFCHLIVKLSSIIYACNVGWRVCLDFSAFFISWSKLKCVCRSFIWLLIFSALLPHLHFQNFQITSTMSLTNLSNPILVIYYYYLKNSFRKFCDFFFFEFTPKKNENFQFLPKNFARKISCSNLVFQKFSLPIYPKLIVLTIDNWQFYVKIFIFLRWKIQVVLNWTFQIFDNQKNKYIECTLYFEFILKF
jgi:hypothetical protein